MIMFSGVETFGTDTDVEIRLTWAVRLVDNGYESSACPMYREASTWSCGSITRRVNPRCCPCCRPYWPADLQGTAHSFIRTLSRGDVRFGLRIIQWHWTWSVLIDSSPISCHYSTAFLYVATASPNHVTYRTLSYHHFQEWGLAISTWISRAFKSPDSTTVAIHDKGANPDKLRRS